MKIRFDLQLWMARLLIGLVMVWNLQAALVFLLSPQAFTSGFELGGVPGETALRGIAVLFVMWNIPYLVALLHPQRNRLSLCEALLMQAVGVLGEGLILFTLPGGHASLHASLGRFILFDACGLVALGLAFYLAGRAPRPASRRSAAGAV